MLPKKHTGKRWPDLPALNAKSRLRVNARRRLFKNYRKMRPKEDYRTTRAPAPFIRASTSLTFAMEVSPGVVMASAP